MILSSSPSTSQATNNFVHRPTRNALQRMESVNRLNDRIRRKLESNNNNNEIYASTSIFDDYIHPKQYHSQVINEEEDGSMDEQQQRIRDIPSETSNRRADRVVDDSFRFISDENGGIGGGGTRRQTPNEKYEKIENNIDRMHLPSQIKKPSNFQRYQSQVAAASAAVQQQQQYSRSQHQHQQPIRLRDSHHHHSKDYHHHKQYPRSLTDPLLNTTKIYSHHIPSSFNDNDDALR
uniref:Uncharacterized protein n=1 Tax=Panagrolaimus sp. PS1159 TaxID=55785 RepID=A0AC35FIP7_9BILA